MSFKIDGRVISNDHSPFIIAEMSANHNGSIKRAVETITAAKECGADAIKLQTYTADTMTIDCDLEDFKIKGGIWNGLKLYDLYKWAETPNEWHEILFAHARSIGITVFSTPFDESAVDLLETLDTPAYKIASFELVDLPLIRYVARLGKPMLLSTGMASEVEIEEAVSAARESGCQDLLLLHCVSSYPAPIDQAQLSRIAKLNDKFGVLSGLSDHTMGTTAAVAAVALGACVIEKHFTLSRKDKGPDSEFSLEPREFRKLCRDARDAWAAIGHGNINRPKVEEANKVFRRSLYFVKDLKAGHIIGSGDIRRIRPGMGLAPDKMDLVVGRALKTDVFRGCPVSLDLVQTS